MADVRSDRKTTVSYAIDLLRAHQLRRENAFLHEEVKSCRKEIVAMHEELKEMRSTVHDCHAVSARASSLFDELKVRIDEQAVDLTFLRHSYQTAQAELADLKTAYDKDHTSTQVQVELFKKEVYLVQVDCRRIEAAHKRQYEDLEASVAALQVLVNEKPDVSLVESLRKRIHELTLPDVVPGLAAGSASRIPDSFERANGIQVRDSQPQEDTRPPPPQSPGLRHEPIRETANATLLSDLDLDANAETISYAGHQYCAPSEVDSLRFLPEPEVPASELAKINTLKQKRFENWAEYYSVGQSLRTSLPDSFEEAIVRRFVEGIFEEKHRRQCQQWLESRGWTWENVTSFNDMFSQNPERFEPSSGSDRGIVSLYSEKIGHIVQEKREQVEERVEGNSTLKKPAPKGRSNAPRRPLRRSQRLVEKETQRETARAEHISLLKGAEPGKGHPKKEGAKGELRPQRRAKRAPIPHSLTTQQPGPDGVGAGDATRVGDTRARHQAKVKGEGIQLREAVTGKTGGRGKRKAVAESVAKIPTAQPLQVTHPRLQMREGEDVLRHNYPLPQLVPQKRPVTDTLEDSSDDVGHLYRHGRAKRLVNEELPGTKRRREQRLPLPPPPEIPILSTSSEE